MIYMQQQALSKMPEYIIALMEHNRHDARHGNDHGWDYEEYEPDESLLDWLKLNVNARAKWKVNVSRCDGVTVKHVETEPIAGLKMAYFTSIDKNIKAVWMVDGEIVHEEEVIPHRWYVMRMDVEHKIA